MTDILRRLIAFILMMPAVAFWDVPRMIILGSDKALDNPLFGRIIDWGERKDNR